MQISPKGLKFHSSSSWDRTHDLSYLRVPLIHLALNSRSEMWNVATGLVFKQHLFEFPSKKCEEVRKSEICCVVVWSGNWQNVRGSHFAMPAFQDLKPLASFSARKSSSKSLITSLGFTSTTETIHPTYFTTHRQKQHSQKMRLAWLSLDWMRFQTK